MEGDVKEGPKAKLSTKGHGEGKNGKGKGYGYDTGSGGKRGMEELAMEDEGDSTEGGKRFKQEPSRGGFIDGYGQAYSPYNPGVMAYGMMPPPQPYYPSSGLPPPGYFGARSQQQLNAVFGASAYGQPAFASERRLSPAQNTQDQGIPTPIAVNMTADTINIRAEPVVKAEPGMPSDETNTPEIKPEPGTEQQSTTQEPLNQSICKRTTISDDREQIPQPDPPSVSVHAVSPNVSSASQILEVATTTDATALLVSESGNNTDAEAQAAALSVPDWSSDKPWKSLDAVAPAEQQPIATAGSLDSVGGTIDRARQATASPKIPLASISAHATGQSPAPATSPVPGKSRPVPSSTVTKAVSQKSSVRTPDRPTVDLENVPQHRSASPAARAPSSAPAPQPYRPAYPPWYIHHPPLPPLGQPHFPHYPPYPHRPPHPYWHPNIPHINSPAPSALAQDWSNNTPGFFQPTMPAVPQPVRPQDHMQAAGAQEIDLSGFDFGVGDVVMEPQEVVSDTERAENEI